MERTKNIGYWVTTCLVCFCMLGGIGQLFQVKQVVDGFAPLGYPTYFISIIGFWKVLAIIALLIPKFPLVKEWAYAGIFFAMTGASASHIAVHDSIFHIIVPLVIASLAICSWYLRPSSRKITTTNS
ncbi:DoxX family protein [Sphingobacterium sp. SRCM116780]|uniref:DoxX family protein n=1 Tax=Sphingobacterium sp. SRCM116780 TaxID=2907623 RepID=UPI001F29B4DA|nr:DoxX family protein [Sphingobacterium sp. SRCM116780]UIR56689.1 DoxX family protein [Sphingobacterium sp. SRCM116780]